MMLPNRQGVANPYEGFIMDAFLNVRTFCNWPLFSITGPMADWVYQELSELEGAHRHTSDFDPQVVRFFLSHMPPERRARRPPAGAATSANGGGSTRVRVTKGPAEAPTHPTYE